MNKYRHLLSFDLSSYGVALAIINEFVDRENIMDFEVSPCGQQAQLILLGLDIISLQVIKAQAEALFKSQILNACLINEINEQLLPTYLSQNKTPAKKSTMIIELSYVSEGLACAHHLLQSGIDILDFRVVRTSPKNVFIIATAENENSLTAFQHAAGKKTVIADTQPILRSYFEIKL